MDKFPDDFNKESLLVQQIRHNNQERLTGTSRKKIHDNVKRSNKNGLRESIFEFPKKLYRKNRIILCNELLESKRSFKVTITFDCKTPCFSGSKPFGFSGDKLVDYCESTSLEESFNSIAAFNSFMKQYPLHNPFIKSQNHWNINKIIIHY